MAFPASAQIATVEEYIKQASVDPKTASEADCEAQVANAALLNPARLFRGASVCFAVRKDVEGNFLLSAGQVRGTADMSLMAPAAKSDREAAAGLYGFIFYYAGGPGNEDVLRDASARERFFRLFDAWTPVVGADYSPDWNVGERPAEADYRQILDEMKAHRRAQLLEFSTLLSDPDYYALHRQSQELQARTSGTYEVGTSEAELSLDLQRRMAKRARALGIDREVIAPEIDAEIPERPPSAPGPGETVVSVNADPVVQECSAWADRLAKMSLSKILRVVITTGSKWGVIWRADIATSDQPPETARLICSQHGTMYEGGDATERPALP